MSEGPTGPSSETKRRRIADDPQDEQSDVDNDEPVDPRRARLEERAAERRRRRLQAEAADLAGAFPGDDYYQGEELREVPDNVVEGNDDYDDNFDERQDDDNDDVQDFVEEEDEDGEYDEDASYAPELDADAAAVLLGGSGRGRKGRGARRGEEEEEGEDLMDDAMKDYQPIAALDTYGREGIDERDYDLMDVDQRRQVERVLAERDRERRRLVLICCRC